MTMSNSGTTIEMIWAASERELQEQLSNHYGITGTLWLAGDFYDEDAEELVYDAFIYFDGGSEHLIADNVPMVGHPESGAVAVDKKLLPPREVVHSIVKSEETE